MDKHLYYCNICDFGTNKKSNFDEHCNTIKHINLFNGVQKLSKTNKIINRSLIIKNLYDKLNESNDFISNQIANLKLYEIFIDNNNKFNHTQLFHINEKNDSGHETVITNNICTICSSNPYDCTFTSKIKGIKKLKSMKNIVTTNKLLEHLKQCQTYEYHQTLEENNLYIAQTLMDELQVSNNNFNLLFQKFSKNYEELKKLKIIEMKHNKYKNMIKILETQLIEEKNKYLSKKNKYKTKINEMIETHKQEIKQLEDKFQKIRDDYDDKLINQLNNPKKSLINNSNTFNGDIHVILANFNSKAPHINKSKDELLESLFEAIKSPEFIENSQNIQLVENGQETSEFTFENCLNCKENTLDFIIDNIEIKMTLNFTNNQITNNIPVKYYINLNNKI